MMKTKVSEYLDKLQKAVDSISDEDLKKLVLESDITEESAKKYAFIEKFLLETKEKETK